MVSYINDLRAQNNLPLLRESCILDASAQAKANDMESQGYFDHFSPNGWTAVDWEAYYGYPVSDLWGVENILWSGTSVYDAFIKWVNSPPHLAQMLSPYYTEVGVGIADGPSFWGMYVLHFGDANTGCSGQSTAVPTNIPTTVPTLVPTQASFELYTNDALNIRLAPSTTAQILGVLPKHTGLMLLDGRVEEGTRIWIKVQGNGITGWVASEYVDGFVTVPVGEYPEPVFDTPTPDIDTAPSSPVAVE